MWSGNHRDPQRMENAHSSSSPLTPGPGLQSGGFQPLLGQFRDERPLPHWLDGLVFTLPFFFFAGIYLFKFLLQDICFTLLCWFLPYTGVNQPQVDIKSLPLGSPSHLPPHPTPLCCRRALGGAPRVTQQIPTGCLFYM